MTDQSMVILPGGRKIAVPEEFREIAGLCVAEEVMIGGRTVLGMRDARDLHAGLMVGRDYTNWIKGRIAKYGFREGVDYEVSQSPNLATGDAAHTGGTPASIYRLNLHMAKELAMVENNERGRAIRRYYIWLEERAHEGGDIDEALVRRIDGISRMVAHKVTGVEKMVTLMARSMEEQDHRVVQVETAVVELAERMKSMGELADAKFIDSLRRLFPPMASAPSLPPPGYQRFPDYLAEKGITCLTGGEKSGLSRRVRRFCIAKGFKIEEGYGRTFRSGTAYPTYALDCWWRDAGGENMVMSLARAHNARASVRGAPLFPINGGKPA